jgi:hypothetical protein
MNKSRERELKPAPSPFAEISFRNGGTNGEILFLGLMRAHHRTQAGVPSSHLSLVMGRWFEPFAFITKSSA